MKSSKEHKAPATAMAPAAAPVPAALQEAELPRLSRFLAKQQHTTKAHAVALIRRMKPAELQRLRREVG